MKNFRTEQSGRSMIEMLAVLAIIGILSVAGISGYSKAMGKFKQQKLADQISTIAANMRTMYAGQGNYSGATTKNSIEYGIIPKDMELVADKATHATGGSFDITPSAGGQGATIAANAGFTMKLGDLDKDSCIFLATSDWGSGTSGLISVTVGAKEFAQKELPVSLSAASTNCSCGTEKKCSVSILMI